MLEQECEESIRNFIRKKKVNEIRDIRSEYTPMMKEGLNTRFNAYGVYIEQVTVVKVLVPRELRIALQQATTYDVFLQNQIKFQENVKIKMTNEENMRL